VVYRQGRETINFWVRRSKVNSRSHKAEVRFGGPAGGGIILEPFGQLFCICDVSELKFVPTNIEIAVSGTAMPMSEVQLEIMLEIMTL